MTQRWRSSRSLTAFTCARGPRWVLHPAVLLGNKSGGPVDVRDTLRWRARAPMTVLARQPVVCFCAEQHSAPVAGKHRCCTAMPLAMRLPDGQRVRMPALQDGAANGGQEQQDGPPVVPADRDAAKLK